MDNQEFAAQLAQFSQLEQLTGIKSLLEDNLQANLALSRNIANSALPGMLGKYARASSDKIHFDGERETTISYYLPRDAVEGKIIIKDANGNEAAEFNLFEYDLKNGYHQTKWGGKNLDGDVLPPGDYYFDVQAKDASGVSIKAEKYSTGKIEAVRFKNEGAYIVIGGAEVPLESVSDISNSEF